MNILHIASNYPPEVGGPATSIPCLAEEQAKHGHNTIILTHGTPHYSENGKIKIYRCGTIKGNPKSISTGIKKIIKMSHKGRKIIKNNKIDIIHSHDTNVSAITKILIDPRSKIPSIIKYSGDLAWETLGLKSKKYIQNPDRFWTSPPAKTILLIERLIFSRFDKTIAQNKYQKKMLQKHLKIKEKKIALIPNAIKKYTYTKKQISQAKKELPKGTKLCSVARLIPWKGIDTIISAIKDIDVRYIIIGDGPWRTHLETLAKKEHVTDKVTFFGKIPHEKVQQYIKSCDLLIVPSLYEPFGIAILDGFAAGIPTIASNTGGIPELVNSNCLFKHNNTKEIKEKIKYALENKQQIMEKQNKKLNKYSWKKIAEKTQKAYENIK